METANLEQMLLPDGSLREGADPGIDPGLLERSVGSVVNALTVADAIGAEGVILHTGSHKGRGLCWVRNLFTSY